jgi:hypothetical protein
LIYKNSYSYREIFLVCSAVAAVLSIDTRLPGLGYADLPIELIAAASLLLFPKYAKNSYLACGFYIAILFSALVSGTLLAGIRYCTIGIFGFFVLAGEENKTDDTFRIFSQMLKISGILLAIWILINPYNSFSRFDLNHALPFTGSKLSAGFVVSLGYITFLYQIQTSKGWHRFFNIFAAIFLGVMLLALEARAATFASLAATLFLLLLNNPTKYLIAGATATPIGWIFFEYFIKDTAIGDRIQARFFTNNPFEHHSFQARVHSWEHYINAAYETPFGVGFEQAHKVFGTGRLSTLQMEVGGAHSEFLKLLVEMGWLPFLLFISLHAIAIIKLLTSKKSDLKILSLLTILTASLQIAVNNEMQQPEVSVLYWLVLGTAFLYKDKTLQKNSGCLE